MTFPGAGASVYRNEAGEVLGWDYPDYDRPEPDPEETEYGRADDWCRKHKKFECDECEDERIDLGMCLDCPTVIKSGDFCESHGPCEGRHDWVCGVMDGSVMADDLLNALHHRQNAGERGPHCSRCEVDYDPEIHGYPGDDSLL